MNGIITFDLFVYIFVCLWNMCWCDLSIIKYYIYFLATSKGAKHTGGDNDKRAGNILFFMCII